jgi:hypothetical protein
MMLFSMLLASCAATGTKVTSDGGTYRAMNDSQQWWCNSMAGCECTMDGKKATCSLVQSCVSSGNCKVAQ